MKSIIDLIVIPKYGIPLFDVHPSKVMLLDEEYKSVDFISLIVASDIFSNILVIFSYLVIERIIHLNIYLQYIEKFVF